MLGKNQRRERITNEYTHLYMMFILLKKLQSIMKFNYRDLVWTKIISKILKEDSNVEKNHLT